MLFLDRVARESFTEKVSFERRLERVMEQTFRWIIEDEHSGHREPRKCWGRRLALYVGRIVRSL